MGNKQSQALVLEQCLLSQEEFAALKKGDYIDHRDYEGRYCKAQIKWKSGNLAGIHYVDWGPQYDTKDNYKLNPSHFAKYKSVSHRQATEALSGYKSGQEVAYRPAVSTNCKWRKGKIVERDTDSGQVRVAFYDNGQKAERWTHLDHGFEIRELVNNSNKKSVKNSSKTSKKKPANNYKPGLSKRNWSKLSKGDCIDYRDPANGEWAAARILNKAGNKARIHFLDYNSTYDTDVNYKEKPGNFAVYGAVTKAAATGALANYKVNDFVNYRPDNDGKERWRRAQIIAVDKKYGSGKVRVQHHDWLGNTYKRWTHLDNEQEIQALPANNHGNNNQSNHGHVQNCCTHNGAAIMDQDMNLVDGNHNDVYMHSAQNRHYQQAQLQQQRQDQLTVRTQLLLDDTQKQLKLTKNYMDSLINGKCNKDEISIYNQKVVVGLTCFKMKVNGMRKNGKSEGIDFGDGFKSSAMIIKKFEQEFVKQFGGNQFLMQRLNPCLNYMRAVLNGHKDIPALPYVDDYEFDEKTASNVISGVAHAQNHVIPDRMKDISSNNDQYKSQQRKLKKEYESGGYNDKVENIDFKNLIQDYNTGNIAFAKSKQEQDAIIEQQQNEYKFKAPDLLNGNGNEMSEDEN